MEYQNLYQDGTPQPPPPAQRKPAGRTRRVVASAAAATVLLGGGAAIGIAMTGGASAAAGGNQPNAQTAANTGALARQCAHLRATWRQAGTHPRGAHHLARLCAGRLRLLIAAGGIHGEVTFQGKQGTRTLAVERGVVQSASASAVTVRAPDGTTWTWEILARTVIRESGHRVPASSLVAGDQVLVAGRVVTGARDAGLIRIRQAT